MKDQIIKAYFKEINSFLVCTFSYLHEIEHLNNYYAISIEVLNEIRIRTYINNENFNLK